MISTLFGTAEAAVARTLIGGDVISDTRNELLKQIIVAVANKTSGGGAGTVTSVSFTGGLISVADPTGAAALTVAGTSGGIPYFDSASTWATSAALAANALLIGGGAGAAPASTTTGTGVLTALGVNVGSVGAFVTNNAANTFTALQTISGATLALSGAISAAAWTTTGIGLIEAARTLTDTSSSGTVALAYTHKMGSNTIAASSVTTFTDYIGAFFANPAAGSNVTLIRRFALGADTLSITGNGAASNPAVLINGTAFFGGNSTTTKPLFLIETAGVTSTGWATQGTTFGVNGSTALGTSANIVDFQYGGTSQFKVNGSGSATLVGSMTAANFTAAAGSWMGWAGRAFLYSPSDGVIRLLNNAENSFGRLCFGPATSGFTALKANTTTLQCRLADDSAYAQFDALGFSVSGTAGVSGTVTAASTVTVVNGIITVIA